MKNNSGTFTNYNLFTNDSVATLTNNTIIINKELNANNNDGVNLTGVNGTITNRGTLNHLQNTFTNSGLVTNKLGSSYVNISSTLNNTTTSIITNNGLIKIFKGINVTNSGNSVMNNNKDIYNYGKVVCQTLNNNTNSNFYNYDSISFGKALTNTGIFTNKKLNSGNPDSIDLTGIEGKVILDFASSSSGTLNNDGI